jgi:hypothetical protein
MYAPAVELLTAPPTMRSLCVTPPALTHSAYAAECQRVGLSERSAVVGVQVRRKGVTQCGQVLACERFSDATQSEWFKVRTDLGVGWFPSAQVRQCSGLDGGCSCTEYPS